jgi:hypothetical protein
MSTVYVEELILEPTSYNPRAIHPETPWHLYKIHPYTL